MGAGVMGLSAAVEIAQAAGHEVTVLERGYPGDGSTSRSAGTYTRQYLDLRDIELRARSVEKLFDLEREGAINLRRIGYVRLGRAPADRHRFERAVDLQRELGVVDPGRVIGPDELSGLVPDLRVDDVDSALYSSAEGYTDGAELCQALAIKAKSRGAKILTRHGLAGARRGSTSRFVLTTTGGLEIEADTVVNCAGAWAEQVGKLLDAPVPTVSERHEMYVFQLPPNLGYTIPAIMDFIPGGKPGLFVRQEGADQLLAGLHTTTVQGSVVTDPDTCPEKASDEGLEPVFEALTELFGDLNIGYRSGWSGMYPFSADYRPIAGPHPDEPEVLVGAGLQGAGLSLGPAMGALLAEWITYGEPRSIAGATDMVPRVA